MWHELEGNYSYKKLLKALRNRKKEIIMIITKTKKQWNRGKRLDFIKAISLSISTAVFGIIFIFNSNKIDLLFEYTLKYLWNHFLVIIGNEQMAIMITLFIALLGALIWNIRSFILYNKLSNRNKKLIIVGRIILIVFFMLPSVCIITSTAYNKILLYLSFILMLLLIVVLFCIKTNDTKFSPHNFIKKAKDLFCRGKAGG